MNSTFSRFCIHRAESPIVAASGCPSTSFSPAPSAAVSRFRASKILRLGPTLLFSALVAIGVLRPSLPEAIRDHWSGWVVALAAVTFGVVLLWARSRESREERFEAYLLALLPLVLAALYLQPQRVASDGIFYYSPLHSLVVDGDLDFANEYRVLGAPAGYFQRTETGRLPNNFSIGPALLWLPWFVLAHTFPRVSPSSRRSWCRLAGGTTPACGHRGLYSGLLSLGTRC